MRKRRGREPEATDPEVLGQMTGSLRAAADGTAGQDLQAALARLPEEYRTVVTLADVESFTMAEVAAIMECPVGTVKSRLFRARALLREQLRDYLPV
jgi:RNA polymerase sigma-70 factor (ECF subfamily)